MAKTQFDEEAIRAALQNILTEIHDLDDPSELNELRRIFRSAVPLFSRAYVAGYLLKKARISSPGQSGRREERSQREERPRNEGRMREERREKKEKRPQDEARSQSAAASAGVNAVDSPVPKENQVTLFFGIGRTRRVFPRDLMALLLETCKLDKDDIGVIKILDNYSFVDVHTDKAQAVIDTLNEFEFRGKSLNVNFAKKKE